MDLVLLVLLLLVPLAIGVSLALSGSGLRGGFGGPGPLEILILLPVPFLGVIKILGGLKLMRFQTSGFVYVAAVVSLVPCTPCFLIGVPMGIWALVVLRQRAGKEAFEDKKRDAVRSVAFWWGVGLLASVLIDALFVGAIVLSRRGVIAFQDVNEGRLDLVLSIGVPAIVLCGLRTAGAIVMLKTEVRRPSMLLFFAAIAAVVPLSIGSLISAPIGIWAIVAMTRLAMQQPGEHRSLIRIVGAVNLVVGLLLLWFAVEMTVAPSWTSVLKTGGAWSTVHSAVGLSLSVGLLAVAVGLLLVRRWALRIMIAFERVRSGGDDRWATWTPWPGAVRVRFVEQGGHACIGLSGSIAGFGVVFVGAIRPASRICLRSFHRNMVQRSCWRPRRRSCRSVSGRWWCW